MACPVKYSNKLLKRGIIIYVETTELFWIEIKNYITITCFLYLERLDQ